MDRTARARTPLEPIPAHRTAGIEVVRAADGAAEIATRTPPELTNIIGSLHSSGLVALLDTAVAHTGGILLTSARHMNRNAPVFLRTPRQEVLLLLPELLRFATDAPDCMSGSLPAHGGSAQTTCLTELRGHPGGAAIVLPASSAGLRNQDIRPTI
ncbi:hypothetical protein AB0M00_40570 [Streptomyces chartreusis]|uniref:PaaI family thioesterase n=1 Tax=Streptomyces TaxID=1883 RepID=UPI0034270016